MIRHEAFRMTPFSLHDARLVDIGIEDKAIRLSFENGFASTEAPYEQVEGELLLERPDLDFCSVYLMDYNEVLCGNYGSFHGEKLSLSDFVRQSEYISLDIADETFGFRKYVLSGFLNRDGRCLECYIEINYEGALQYLIEERPEA